MSEPTQTPYPVVAPEDRYIPVNPGWVLSWYGPIDVLRDGEWYTWGLNTYYTLAGQGIFINGKSVEGIRLDPARPEVRDHLSRVLEIPVWVREPRQRAVAATALVWCWAKGVPVTEVPENYWRPREWTPTQRRAVFTRGGILLPVNGGVLWTFPPANPASNPKDTR